MKLFLRLVFCFVLLALLLGVTVYLAPLEVVDARTRFHLWRAGVRSQFVQVDGYRLHYFEAAVPAGKPDRPLVLIHGLGSRGEDWAPLIPSLAANGFHVYALDLPGFGRSTKPDVDYSMKFQAGVVADFMRAVHLSRADVVGWSMGGWVAAELSLAHPEMVDRLALYDAAGVYFPRTFDAELFLPKDEAGMQRLSAMLTPHPQAIPHFIAREAMAKLESNRTVTERAVGAMLYGHDLLDFRLHSITQPTLLVWGKEDRLIPVATAETMHREIRDSVLVEVEGCGHLTPSECSVPVLRATLDFFDSPEAPARGEQIVPKQ